MNQQLTALIQRVKRKLSSLRDRRLRGLVGMTTLEERRYWRGYAARRFSATFSLGEGLDRNTQVPADAKRIHAYDLFRWEDWMEPFVGGTPFAGKFRPGDDFTEAFRYFTRRHADKIVCRRADLTRETWTGGNIEFLLVDAMKSWELCNALYRNFFPSLKAGTSEILHQDFAHGHTYWIHLLQFRLREYFRVVEGSAHGGSLAFTYVRPIPGRMFDAEMRKEDFDRQEIDAAFAHSLEVSGAVAVPAVLAAKVMAYLELVGKAPAAELLQQILRQGHAHYDLEVAHRAIQAA
jgi:hypothetical protein